MSSHSTTNLPLTPLGSVPFRSRRRASVSGHARSGRGPRWRWLAPVLAVAALAAACSTGPGTQEELEQILTDGGSISPEEASCIAAAIFDEYETDDDALGKISAAPDFQFLDGEEGVPGFSEFFDQTVNTCAGVGPTVSN